LVADGGDESEGLTFTGSEGTMALVTKVTVLQQTNGPAQLFVYRNLYTWLDCPFEAPPALVGIHDAQLALHLGLVGQQFTWFLSSTG
jgi:hypothetical protein